MVKSLIGKEGNEVVQRVSLAWIIDLVDSINMVRMIHAESEASSVRYAITEFRVSIDRLLNQSVYGPYLSTSREKAAELIKVLSQIETHLDINPQISNDDLNLLYFGLNQLTPLLREEMATYPVFLVSRKDAFDTDQLIDRGSTLFPRKLLDKVPETYNDALGAGKSLAFELATACGFHSFRVVESVVRRYWDIVTKKAKRPCPETLGKFAGELEQKKLGDEKIIEAIKQMTKLHRNPLAHPDVFLTLEEAIGIVGMARSVIAPMLEELPDSKS